MALARTNLLGQISGASGTFGTGAFTTTNFTPVDNSLLVVGVSFIENGSSTDPASLFTISGGGWTYTQRKVVTVNPTSFPTVTLIYTAPVTTGALMALTLDCGARSVGEYAVSAVCYTGYNTSTPTGATASGTKNSGFTGPPDPFSITLSGAPATGDEVFAIVGIDKTVAGVTPGSTYTEVHDVTNTDWGGGESEIRTGSTSTTVDWVDLRSGGGALFNCAACAVVIQVAAGGTTFTISPTGSSASSGALAKQDNKALVGTSASAGALAKLAQKALTGVSSATGALTRLAKKALTGSSASSGTLTSSSVKTISVGGSSTPTGTLTRLTSKNLSGVSTPAGALRKQISKSLVGSSSSTGVVSNVRVILRTFIGSSASSGTLTRLTGKALVGAASPVGALVKLAKKALTGASTPSGAETNVKSTPGSTRPGRWGVHI